MFREANGRVTFAVKVVPRASKNEIAGLEGGVVRIRLTAPPVEGKANEAVEKFLASLLAVPRSSVDIIAGHSSRNKTISIRGLGVDQVEKAILEQISRS